MKQLKLRTVSTKSHPYIHIYTYTQPAIESPIPNKEHYENVEEDSLYPESTSKIYILAEKHLKRNLKANNKRICKDFELHFAFSFLFQHFLNIQTQRTTSPKTKENNQIHRIQYFTCSKLARDSSK